MASLFIRDVIQDCYSKVESDIYSGELLSELFSQKCISYEEKLLVDCCLMSFDKGRKMLDVLTGKLDSKEIPDLVLDVIVEFLHTHQPQHHLEGIIRESGLKFGYSFNISECSTKGLCSAVRRKTRRILSETWWPARKEPIKSFVERRLNEDDTDTTLIVHNLHKQLLSGGGINSCAVISNVVAIVGMAGVGKTSIVKSYANEYQGEYDHIIWIDSAGTALYNSLTRLGRKLEVIQPQQGNDAEFHLRGRLVELLHDIYGKLKNAQCLFVFDNAERFIGQHGLSILPPRNEVHHCLITSRNHDWGKANANIFGQIPTLQLDVFTEAECILLLSSTLGVVSGKGGTKYEMVALGEQLGFLPLALQCALLTILETRKYTLKSYLQDLRKDVKIVMDRQIKYEYEITVSETFQNSVNQLITMNEGIDSKCRDWCITILNVFAYCEPNVDVQEALLVEVWKENAHEISEALDILISHSLVYANAKEDPSHEGMRILGGMHPLMQQVIRHEVGVGGKRERLINELTSVLYAIPKAARRNLYRQHEICIWNLASEQLQEILLTCHGVPHCWQGEEEAFYMLTLEKLSALSLGELDLRVVQLNFKLLDAFIHGGNYVARAYKSRILYNRLKQELVTAYREKILYARELLLHLRFYGLDIEFDNIMMTTEDEVNVDVQSCLTASGDVLRELLHAGYEGVINQKYIHLPAALSVPEIGLRGSLMLSSAVIQDKFRRFKSGHTELALIFVQLDRTWRRIYNVCRHLRKCPKLFDAIIPNLFELVKTDTAERRMETRAEHLPQVVEIVHMYMDWLVKQESQKSTSKYLDTLIFLHRILWAQGDKKTVKLLLRLLNRLSLSALPDREQEWEEIRTALSYAWKTCSTWIRTQSQAAVGIHFMLKINSIYLYMMEQIGIDSTSDHNDLDKATMIVLTDHNIGWYKIFQPCLEEFIRATLNFVNIISEEANALSRVTESEWEPILKTKVLSLAKLLQHKYTFEKTRK